MKRSPFVYYSETVVGVKTKKFRRRDLPALDHNEFQLMNTIPFSLSPDGKVFVNISDKNNMIFVYYFLSMAESLTKNLMAALEEAKTLYPDIEKPEDIINYTDKRKQKEIGFKIMIPYELERRKRELINCKNK